MSTRGLQSLHGLAAPAKLNLFLHVIGRRADGFHLLQSVFVLVDWCDTIDLDLRTNGDISREVVSNEAGVTFEVEDLCTRAARALQCATGTALGAHIRLHKRIPAQAGLGGGSSDAATTLKGLRRLWQLNLSDGELEQIGLTLGADVPFFLRGQNAWVEGIGEQITPLDPKILPLRTQFCIVKPPIGLPTPAIFRSPQLKRDTQTAILVDFAADPWGFGTNDLQAVACGINPQVAQAIDWMISQPQLLPRSARMSGSGSAAFAVLSEAKISLDLRSLPSGWVAKQCGLLAHHPLLGW